MSETETVKGISGKGTQPVDTKEKVVYGQFEKLVNVRIQASRPVCEHLSALLQRNSGLLTTGFTEEKGGIGIWRLYLTCPESRVWKL